MTVPLTYFYRWEIVSDAMLCPVMTEFRANGAENLVLDEHLCERFLTDRHYFTTVDSAARGAGIRLFETHAPFGPCFDLNCSEGGRRKGLIDDHTVCMEYAAAAGCKTYVIHIGAYDCVCRPEITFETMRKLACESLEKLIPVAERLGLVIAIENAFERSNSPDEVLYLLKRFPSPAVGCCFDVGHANFMAPDPKVSPKPYSEYMVKNAWRGEVRTEDRALEKLLPYIVTSHLHDNSGYGDDHNLPGRGTVDWAKLIPALKAAPRLQSLQSEVNPIAHRLSIAEVCRTMARIAAL